MRSISAGLLAAQQAATGKPLVTVGLTKPGAQGYNYQTSEDDAGRIFSIIHTEGAYSGGALIRLKNHDKALTNIDLKGYRVAIGWGFFGPNEVSTSAPMHVWSQRTISEEGELLVELVCLDSWENISRSIVRGETTGPAPGWNLPPAAPTTTVRQIIEQLLTNIGFSFIVDSQDNQAANYKPYYSVDLNTPVRDVIRQLLGMTRCAIRWRTGGASGTAHLIHLQDGDPVDYEYDSAHAFFSDVREEAAPSYNCIIVQSRELAIGEKEPYQDFYQGTAKDDASIGRYGLIPQVITYTWVKSNSEAATLASCILERAKAEAAQGNIIVPMNCAQEIYDKVRVIDSRAGCEVIGRVGVLIRTFASGQYRLEIRLGGVSAAGIVAGPEALLNDITGLTQFPPYQRSQYGGGIPLGGIGRWLQPIAVDIDFSSPAWNIVNWTAGYIRFADGGSQAINSGSYTFSAYNQRMYLYFKIGYNTLFSTTDFATAACGNDRAIVALIRSGSDSYQRAMIVTFRGKEPYLNSAAIAEGAVTSALLKKTAQPFNCSVTFSGIAWNGVHWSGGAIAFADGSSYAINAGSLTGIPATSTRYIYYTLNNPTLSTTSDYTQAIGDDRVLLCIVTTGTSTQGTKPVILPMTSKGLTVNAVAIAADVITTDMLQANCVVASKVAAKQILAGHIDVTTLSAISANLGLINAGEIRLGIGALGSFTGWRLWVEGGYGYMAGYKSGAVKVLVGKDGIKLDGTSSFSGSLLQFWDGGVLRGAAFTQSNNRLRLEGNAGLDLASGAGASVNIAASANAQIMAGGDILLKANGWEYWFVDQCISLPTGARINGVLVPLDDLSGRLGEYDNRWSYSYINAMYSYYNCPRQNNTGYVGTVSRYWSQMRTWDLYYKVLYQFQGHDDIALVKSMKSHKKDKGLIDPASAQIIRGDLEDGEEGDPGYNLGKSIGLIFGTLQQLIARVEKLEEK